MNPRLIVILVALGFLSAGTITWIVLKPETSPVSRPGAAAMSSSSDEEKRRHREQFFGGNSDRNIRGGQEMKPRW